MSAGWLFQRSSSPRRLFEHEPLTTSGRGNHGSVRIYGSHFHQNGNGGNSVFFSFWRNDFFHPKHFSCPSGAIWSKLNNFAMISSILSRRKRKFSVFRAPQTILPLFLVTLRKNLENVSIFFRSTFFLPKRKNLFFLFQTKKTLGGGGATPACSKIRRRDPLGHNLCFEGYGEGSTSSFAAR